MMKKHDVINEIVDELVEKDGDIVDASMSILGRLLIIAGVPLCRKIRPSTRQVV